MTDPRDYYVADVFEMDEKINWDMVRLAARLAFGRAAKRDGLAKITIIKEETGILHNEDGTLSRTIIFHGTADA